MGFRQLPSVYERRQRDAKKPSKERKQGVLALATSNVVGLTRRVGWTQDPGCSCYEFQSPTAETLNLIAFVQIFDGLEWVFVRLVRCSGFGLSSPGWVLGVGGGNFEIEPGHSVLPGLKSLMLQNSVFYLLMVVICAQSVELDVRQRGWYSSKRHDRGRRQSSGAARMTSRWNLLSHRAGYLLCQFLQNIQSLEVWQSIPLAIAFAANTKTQCVTDTSPGRWIDTILEY